MKSKTKKLHACHPPDWTTNKPNWGMWGNAIECCEENEKGEFWVDNGEYSSRVNFCPYCGTKAPAQIKKV